MCGGPGQLGELVRSGSVLECERPASRGPLETAEVEAKDQSSGPLRRLALPPSSPTPRACTRARSISPRRSEDAGRARRAGSGGTRAASPSCSSISTPRSSRPGVISAVQPSALANSAIAVASRTGSPTRSACSSAARPSASAARTSASTGRSNSAEPGSAQSGRRRQPLRRAHRCRARSTGEALALRVKARANRTSDRSAPDGTSVRSCSSSAARPLAGARETVEVCCPQHVAARAKGRIVRRQLDGELVELGRRRGRPAGGGLLGCRCPAPPRRPHRALRRRAPGAGPAPRYPKPRRPAPGERHGASRSEPPRSRSRRAADARNGSRSRPG